MSGEKDGYGQLSNCLINRLDFVLVSVGRRNLGGLPNDGGDHSHFRKHILMICEFSSTYLKYCQPVQCSTADLVELPCLCRKFGTVEARSMNITYDLTPSISHYSVNNSSSPRTPKEKKRKEKGNGLCNTEKHLQKSKKIDKDRFCGLQSTGYWQRKNCFIPLHLCP